MSILAFVVSSSSGQAIVRRSCCDPSRPPMPFFWPGVTDLSVDREGRVLAVVEGRELVVLTP